MIAPASAGGAGVGVGDHQRRHRLGVEWPSSTTSGDPAPGRLRRGGGYGRSMPVRRHGRWQAAELADRRGCGRGTRTRSSVEESAQCRSSSTSSTAWTGSLGEQDERLLEHLQLRTHPPGIDSPRVPERTQRLDERLIRQFRADEIDRATEQDVKSRAACTLPAWRQAGSYRCRHLQRRALSHHFPLKLEGASSSRARLPVRRTPRLWRATIPARIVQPLLRPSRIEVATEGPK